MTTTETPAPLTPVTIGTDEQPSWGSAPAAAPTGTDSETGHEDAGTAPSAPTFVAPSGPTPPPAARFFDTIRRSGVTRPDRGSGRMVAGVASGLARRWDVDPVVVRVAFVVLTFVGGLGASLYGLGWLFLPHPDGRIHAQQLLLGRLTAGFVGALLATLAVTDGAVSLIVAALAVTLILLLARNRRPRATVTTPADTL